MDLNEDREHLKRLECMEEGAGCVEIWEELSERRSKAKSTEN